jgi:hypothetical protein
MRPEGLALVLAILLLGQVVAKAAPSIVDALWPWTYECLPVEHCPKIDGQFVCAGPGPCRLEAFRRWSGRSQ